MSNKFIQKGWESYRQNVVPADAPAIQIKETRQAFFAGASILFEGLMQTLDSDQEPTAGDLQKMADIQAEVSDFGAELDQKAFGQNQH